MTVGVAVLGVDGLGKGLQGLVHDLLVLLLTLAQAVHLGPGVQVGCSGRQRQKHSDHRQPEGCIFRELLVLVGNEEVVAQMTANNRRNKRYSGLRHRLTDRMNA